MEKLPRFFNHNTKTYETEATRFDTRNERWYIEMHFAGWNSPSNNTVGYPTKESAERAIIKYQKKRGPG